jgi:Icc-related predicted phosphoesterase
MPSVCVIADTHRRHRELDIPECDILIHCGDFCSFHKDDEETLEDADQWFAELPAQKILCIGGNHDFPIQSREFRFAHAEVLEDRLVEVDGLKIYGTPWCPDLSGFAYYASDDELIEKWKLIPDQVDILITHTPPYGILDQPTGGNIHLGCKHLLRELGRIRPRLHVFGHIHASHGVHEEEARLSVNAAVVGGPNLDLRHMPLLFELDEHADR